MSRLITCLASLATTVCCIAAEGDLAWPRFRGPRGASVAQGANPPVEFGPEKNVKWKVPVPSGLSSPIIAGDSLVLTALDDGKLVTIAYRRSDGQEAWRADAEAKELEKYHKTEGSPAASTPCTDGRHIVSYFGSCGLRCYDLAGKELWRYELPVARGGGDFGSGVSPIIVDGLVILVRDVAEDAKILALDAASGRLVWETKRQSPISYSTPVVWDTSGGKQIAVAGHARLMGYDLATGAEKWSVAGIPSGCCPSPVVVGGKLYFAGSMAGASDDGDAQPIPTFDAMLKDLDKDQDGAISRAEGEKAFEGFFDSQDVNKDGKVTRDEWDIIMKFFTEGKSACLAVRPGGVGDVTSTHVLFNKSRGLPNIASALVYQGQFVMLKDGGVLTALDPETGDQIYQKRAAASGTYYASPVAAANHIYCVSLADGTVTVIEAGLNEPKVVATNPPLGERVAATPAIVGDTIYIRTAGHLYAFAEAP